MGALGEGGRVLPPQSGDKAGFQVHHVNMYVMAECKFPRKVRALSSRVPKAKSKLYLMPVSDPLPSQYSEESSLLSGP